MRPLSPQQRFEAAERVRNFLADDAVKDALTEMTELNYAEFIAAQSDEFRRNAWAQARVLSDFSARMVGLMEDGAGARAEILAEQKRTSAPVSQ